MSDKRPLLVVHAHPVPESYSAALRDRTIASLKARGHEVDLLDLYAERFDPVLSEEERRCYHDVATNRRFTAPYVDRILAARGIILIFPVWNFGYPAILKGFLDRVNLPGVFFRLEGGVLRPSLHNIKALAAVTTYGSTPLRAFLAGDPPRKSVTRHLRHLVHPKAKVRYLAHYGMNKATAESRKAFLDRVGSEFSRW